ncbi:fumarylacetoacetate hydrolase family protein [Candidatus Chlorohelix allophototropha]|uniref:Fumarylacetoacetate hydrolase family protein n=2 Tax=Candidatus Chlorohelix allophototropha TaxID=3003348 RepID=A0ABY9B936_9CHLR|nr:fumarylacetoacetate hydrolase family protein [Chloroflexota bacterium L227-S17]
MKLVSYVLHTEGINHRVEMYAHRQAKAQGGVLVGNRVYDLSQVCAWADARKDMELVRRANTVLEFLHLPIAQQRSLSRICRELPVADMHSLDLGKIRLRAPLEVPPSLRDFYSFEHHVKTARANRGLEMIPEWYKIPAFYFSNHRAIYGNDEYLPYPRESSALDFELELACVIGKPGRDVPAAKASDYIGGYLIMNDWSARDLQMEEIKVGLGPAKGKDFATSLGPCLITPDELEDKRIGVGEEERFDLVMKARLNGREVSLGNFKDIHYTFSQMIERASLNAWIEPGDVLGSGTVGTGCLLEQGEERERWLQPGDVVELEIERLGILRNTVVSGDV